MPLGGLFLVDELGLSRPSPEEGFAIAWVTLGHVLKILITLLLVLTSPPRCRSLKF